MSEEIERVKLAFMYTTKGKGGKPVYNWIDMGDNSIRQYRGNNGRNIITAKPGMVFTFPEKDGQLYINKWVLLQETYPDQQQVITWAALEKSYWQLHRAKLKLTKALKEDALLSAIEPIANAYRRLPGVSKDQFLAWVVSRITKEVNP